MIRYYWCSICKTASAWNLDFSGCYPETLLFSCSCGVITNDQEEWEHIRKFVSSLPEIPEKGVRYKFARREYII
ncbi:MAG TPA: hypothetical protein DEQ20_04890 [Desulfobulbaceae bacterium]|nr:hypothetical protein [Desulfobulbaceae bacterium]